VVDGAKAVLLIVAELASLALTLVVFRNRDGGEGGALAAKITETLKIAAGEEGGDRAGVGDTVIPEVDQLAVGEKDEGSVELLGVGKRLVFGGVGVDGLLLGLNDGERAALLVEEHVVGTFGADRFVRFIC
jgi:hypothetical protein